VMLQAVEHAESGSNGELEEVAATSRVNVGVCTARCENREEGQSEDPTSNSPMARWMGPPRFFASREHASFRAIHHCIMHNHFTFGTHAFPQKSMLPCSNTAPMAVDYSFMCGP